MKRLRKKLNDQSGASILLALLFFLLCSMVGASILMAAVSNAGKIRSNREEQQKYLLLSSALRLVCDELTSAEYYGQYTYRIYETQEELVGDDDTTTQETHIHYNYKQKSGKFECGLNDNGVLLLDTLTAQLDLIFARKFPASTTFGLNHYEYEPSTGTFTSPSYELTLSVTSPDGVEGLKGLKDEVTVTVTMDEDLRIRLTAVLKEDTDNNYTMEALLTPRGGNPKFSDASGSEAGVENQAEPMTWTLEWIAKKEAGQ